ncbi:extracellular matrix regulator RemB [Brevibacillus sp. B_LB10_24]|uniref:extracellular matrix regulator RemB n=1 Tax=Brevibacillus sp. B_LB10_24 TaxID=3380645 RepID=UPI0038B939C7
MFIHIGGDTVVFSKDVISILDHQSVKTSKITRKFIEDERKVKHFVDHSTDETKSYVITKDAIYCSPISSLTLKRRAQFVDSLDQFPSVQTDLEELT